MLDLKACLNVAICAALEAGQAILDVYESADCSVEYKSDNSPPDLCGSCVARGDHEAPEGHALSGFE